MILEILMMLCFGVAWPINIYNSIKSKSTKGKNILFLATIALAYVFGVLYKAIYSPNVSLVFYLINLTMVIADIILYFLNRSREIARNEIMSYFELYF